MLLQVGRIKTLKAKYTLCTAITKKWTSSLNR